MPLIGRCEKCGEEVMIKKLQEMDNRFEIEYECKKCKTITLEEIPKRWW